MNNCMGTTRKRRPWDTRKGAFEEAAKSVLLASKKPLSLGEIMSRMIEANLVQPTGKTPVNSLYTILRRANQRRASQSESPLFVAHKDTSGRVRYELGLRTRR
jgi:hypothetical protein